MLKIHKQFKLNNNSFYSKDELLKYSKTVSNSLFIFLTEWFNNNDYIIVQTSGSTGKPKPISLKKEFMINSAKATGIFFNVLENTTALLCLPIEYIAGKMMFIRALTLGWKLDIIEPTSTPLTSINNTYDFSAMVPMQLQNSILKLNKIKKLIVGGGEVSIDLQEKIQHVPTEIFATYGMTETITHIAAKPLNNSINNKLISYQTLPNIFISTDSRNCLVIKAPKIAEGEIITNDVVKIISEKEFEWLGRYDNVINSGGIKLHPEKIEQKLSQIITNRFFVSGIKDKLLGEKLILIVEGTKQDFNFSTVTNLTKYEIPKSVYFINQFIETETKKIQRKKTLDLLALKN